jgi:hypothetical protein
MDIEKNHEKDPHTENPKSTKLNSAYLKKRETYRWKNF